MYQIGDFKFNTKLAQLIAPCGKVHDLTPLAFHLLIYLVENNDRLINKRELILKVWKHEVSDSSINKTVSILRAMFGDCAQESRYIITRRKLGYRLIAEVQNIYCSLDNKGKAINAPVLGDKFTTIINS